jgi:LacI family fructose operon transcriptional repressor
MTVNIKDVARAAGVSPATVSRVLGDGPVSAELRAQVEAAVRETGYRPNLSARRLRSRNARTIGLIVADIANPFFTALSRAVEEEAYRQGLRVILCNTGEDPKREAMYLRLMEEERVTGVIVAATRQSVAELDRATWDFPTVLVDRAGPSVRHDAVVLDNHGAAAALVDHLRSQGLTRIAGLFGNASTTGIERHAGYVAAMEAAGLAPQARFMPPAPASAEAALAELLCAPAPPDAVIASNGLLLMGAYRAARTRQLRMPDDLALAGFDNESWTDLVEPGLTVIEQPVAAMGQAAMAMLLERIDAPARAQRRVVLAGRCVVRGSTAAGRGGGGCAMSPTRPSCVEREAVAAEHTKSK